MSTRTLQNATLNPGVGSIPAYQLGPRGRAFAIVDGKKVRLGRYGTPDSKARYLELVARIQRRSIGLQLLRLGKDDGNMTLKVKLPKRKPRERKPVHEDVVLATLPHLSRNRRDMVRFQLATGCSDEDVCWLTPGMLRMGANGWEVCIERTYYRVGIRRIIPVSTEAFEILKPYLDRPGNVCCFSSTRQVGGPERIRNSRHDYRRDVVHAVRKAFPVQEGMNKQAWTDAYHWTPNRLPRSTEIREETGIDLSRNSKTGCSTN